MALIENTFFGEIDKVRTAIDRLRLAAELAGGEPFYLAFSGGKDSQTIYHLAREAGVNFDAHYNITGIDPPELVYFIRDKYPDVIRDMYEKSMFRLIVDKGIPPTRLIRYCCAELKERGGKDRICVTGVRWDESSRRKNTRGAIEIQSSRAKHKMLFNDNDEARRQFEVCITKGKKIINPIIDWSTGDVWDFLNSRGIEHCCLYDEGFNRLGCIGCPMAGVRGRMREFARYPKFRDYYLRAFAKMLESRKAKGKDDTTGNWKDAESVFAWWTSK
jgi:phosphoadenosine phosphosulfate reductase